MKRLVLLFLFTFCPIWVMAAEKWEVEFSECIDGDTANFIHEGEEVKVRFLAVDTPETKHPTKGEEPFGKEASEYTCQRIKTAEKIVLEFDEGSDEKDKYDRYLVWVFVDDSLLQKELIEKGFAKVDYIYGDYQYTTELEEAQEKAIEEMQGMWGEEDKSALEKEKQQEKIKKIAIIALVIIVIIIAIFNRSVRKKLFNKVEKGFKKELKKALK